MKQVGLVSRGRFSVSNGNIWDGRLSNPFSLEDWGVGLLLQKKGNSIVFVCGRVQGESWDPKGRREPGNAEPWISVKIQLHLSPGQAGLPSYPSERLERVCVELLAHMDLIPLLTYPCAYGNRPKNGSAQGWVHWRTVKGDAGPQSYLCFPGDLAE